MLGTQNSTKGPKTLIVEKAAGVTAIEMPIRTRVPNRAGKSVAGFLADALSMDSRGRTLMTIVVTGGILRCL